MQTDAGSIGRWRSEIEFSFPCSRAKQPYDKLRRQWSAKWPEGKAAIGRTRFAGIPPKMFGLSRLTQPGVTA